MVFHIESARVNINSWLTRPVVERLSFRGRFDQTKPISLVFGWSLYPVRLSDIMSSGNKNELLKVWGWCIVQY